MKVVLSNMWLFKSVIYKIFEPKPELNALVRLVVFLLRFWLVCDVLRCVALRSVAFALVVVS